jgi:hypothetical protein
MAWEVRDEQAALAALTTLTVWVRRGLDTATVVVARVPAGSTSPGPRV